MLPTRLVRVGVVALAVIVGADHDRHLAGTAPHNADERNGGPARAVPNLGAAANHAWDRAS